MDVTARILKCEGTEKTRLFSDCYFRNYDNLFSSHSETHPHTHLYTHDYPHTSKCTYLHIPVFALMHAWRRNTLRQSKHVTQTNATIMEDAALTHTSTIKMMDWLAHSGGDFMNDASTKRHWFKEPTTRQAIQRRIHIDELVSFISAVKTCLWDDSLICTPSRIYDSQCDAREQTR